VGGGEGPRLADIYDLAWPLKPGMDGRPREVAEQVLAARRRKEAEELSPPLRQPAKCWTRRERPAPVT
jgi:hypothetical protein